jgi:hypothetical protein
MGFENTRGLTYSRSTTWAVTKAVKSRQSTNKLPKKNGSKAIRRPISELMRLQNSGKTC